MEQALEFVQYFFMLLFFAALFMTGVSLKKRSNSEMQGDRYHCEVMAAFYGMSSLILFVLILCILKLLP
ncbi:MAG: hypothetical protein EOO20_05445 [Chryseobacterium sp.]|nr:MAG: hypothetical protein EOO20_05445 [Chryseobacterium sp.]